MSKQSASESNKELSNINTEIEKQDKKNNITADLSILVLK